MRRWYVCWKRTTYLWLSTLSMTERAAHVATIHMLWVDSNVTIHSAIQTGGQARKSRSLYVCIPRGNTMLGYIISDARAVIDWVVLFLMSHTLIELSIESKSGMVLISNNRSTRKGQGLRMIVHYARAVKMDIALPRLYKGIRRLRRWSLTLDHSSSYDFLVLTVSSLTTGLNKTQIFASPVIDRLLFSNANQDNGTLFVLLDNPNNWFYELMN
jgi:hypothetical protein